MKTQYGHTLPACTRRTFLASAAGMASAALLPWGAVAAEPFSLTYSLASCMYGTLPLAEVVAAAPQTGATVFDLWPAVHANHREQMDAMGIDAYLALCETHGVTTGVITRYDLGPMKLQPEMAVAQQLGATILVTGSTKPADDLKAGVAAFVEALKPHAAVAADRGVTIAIENHANALIESPDSLRYFVEALGDLPNVGVAFAPYHLPQDPAIIADLIRDMGPRLTHFYAWEHGNGCHEPLPKALEMQQLPGYGQLDFGPILQALRDIGYTGWTSIFMHPVPRGIPILPTADQSTEAINRSRDYLGWKLDQLNA